MRRIYKKTHENLGELTPAIFRDFRKTPTKTRYRQIARFLFGVFLAAACFQGTPLSKCRGFTFPARAAGMRQMGCAYRKAWLSDAQKIYFMFTRSSAGCCLRNAVIGETTPRGAVRLAAGFSSVPRDWGHAFYKCAAHSPFPVQLPAVR